MFKFTLELCAELVELRLPRKNKQKSRLKQAVIKIEKAVHASAPL
jgi:hypothetical protein